ncbi:translocon-associated protein subunit beta-like [Corticium candelabrum]|uniref:translocon-associated protein subunit beta-like n=1 Tax=Corticium candelabrum TaxID=121492 RepID=UPI002E25DC83|nr:translocon-associated protein subunit beta-like [Corticium candelabrum]
MRSNDYRHVFVMLQCIWLVCLVLFAGSPSDAAENDAHLLSSKEILNLFIVQGKDVTVQYKIYNTGASSALFVTLTDDSFPADKFEFVRGQHAVRWDRISPGSNVSHVIIVRPLEAGNFNFSMARVAYKPAEGREEKVSFTSSPGVGMVVTGQAFNREHSPHILDWAAFAVMAAPTIVIPFLIWLSSYSRYNGKMKKA